MVNKKHNATLSYLEKEGLKKNDFLENLNKKFFKKCEEYLKLNKSFHSLFKNYNILFDDNKHNKANFDVSSDFDDLATEVSHQLQSSENDLIEKKKNIKFRNSKNSVIKETKNKIISKNLTSSLDHKCLDNEIYKFLVRFFDVKCPLYTTKLKKKKINIETEEDDFVWPFLEPPKKPRSVFDTGPTREEVGEFNRRIFAAYTEYLDSDKDKILFSYNPNFSDEESCDIEEHDIVSNLYKSEIELFLYNGTEFIHQDKCIIKIFINNLSEKIVHINSMKYKFSFESDSILVYEFFEDVKVDILNLNDLHIYRLVFVDCRHCKKFNFVYNAK